MGEIKSTLEIIMEKTKGMILSEEEKREFKLREIRGKAGGLIQRFIDGFIDLETLKVDMAALGKEEQDNLAKAVMEESISRINLGEDNAMIMQVLEATDGIDPSPIKKLLHDMNRELIEKKREMEKELEIKLKEKGITGSGVIPNPDADPDWIGYVAEKKRELNIALRKERSNLWKR